MSLKSPLSLHHPQKHVSLNCVSIGRQVGPVVFVLLATSTLSLSVLKSQFKFEIYISKDFDGVVSILLLYIIFHC